MAAPEPGPAAAFDAASDRAALLRYVLDHVLERCALPDGVSNAAHLNLDRVDVPALLASLREPGGRPDLRAATGSTAGAPSAVDASNATGTNDDSDLPPVVSFELVRTSALENLFRRFRNRFMISRNSASPNSLPASWHSCALLPSRER